MTNRWKALSLAAALLFTSASMAGDKRKPSHPKPVSHEPAVQSKGRNGNGDHHLSMPSAAEKQAAAEKAKRRAAAAAEAKRKARDLEEARRRALAAEQAKKQAADQAKKRELADEESRKKTAEEARRQLLAADAKKKVPADLAARSTLRSPELIANRQPNQIAGRNLDVVRDRSAIKDLLLKPVDL